MSIYANHRTHQHHYQYERLPETAHGILLELRTPLEGAEKIIDKHHDDIHHRSHDVERCQHAQPMERCGAHAEEAGQHPPHHKRRGKLRHRRKKAGIEQVVIPCRGSAQHYVTFHPAKDETRRIEHRHRHSRDKKHEHNVDKRIRVLRVYILCKKVLYKLKHTAKIRISR